LKARFFFGPNPLWEGHPGAAIPIRLGLVLCFFVLSAGFPTRIQKILMRSLLQGVDNKRSYVWHADCYIEGASDDTAAGTKFYQPKNSRHPARASANEAALIKRENRPGKPAVGTVEQPPAT
jgi:hypothetical protein